MPLAGATRCHALISPATAARAAAAAAAGAVAALAPPAAAGAAAAGGDTALTLLLPPPSTQVVSWPDDPAAGIRAAGAAEDEQAGGPGVYIYFTPLRWVRERNVCTTEERKNESVDPSGLGAASSTLAAPGLRVTPGLGTLLRMRKKERVHQGV